MIKTFFLISFFLFYGCLIFANQTDDWFRQGNEAFQQKKFEAAVKLYEQVLDSGYQSAELEYNLGNAYFRQNITGQAILHYERALLLAPGDADIHHNLEIAKQRVQGDLEILPEFFLTRWWRQLRNFTGSGTWGIAALILWWAGAAGFILWLLGKTRRQKKTGFIAGLICLSASILPFVLAWSRANYEQNTNFVIVLEPSAALRSAPDESGTDVRQLYEGTKVKLQDQLGDWWQVKLENGETGWLNKDTFERI